MTLHSTSLALVNPYSRKNFFSFFLTFGKRFFQMFSGDLAPDEVQMIVLILIALSSALSGTFLVLRKKTMIANSLSHTILLGIILAFILVKSLVGLKGEVGLRGDIFSLSISKLLIGALIAALCTTFATECLHKKFRLQEDASIGLVFTAFFALGVVLVTLLSRNSHLGIEAIMGNVDALHSADIKIALYLFLFNAALLLLFFRPLEMVSFDSLLAQNMGISILFFDYLMMFQTALTAVGAFQAVGAFLFLSFLVTPVLTARFFTHRLKPLLFLTSILGAMAASISVALSRHMLTIYQIPLSTSGLSSVILGLFFLIGLLHRRRATH